MAYENLELIVVFNGSKGQFKPADYPGKLVLVTGGYDQNTFTAKDPYLYAIDVNGNYRIFDVPSSWVSGIKAPKKGTTSGETITLQGIAEFMGNNGVSVSIDSKDKKLVVDGLGLLGDADDPTKVTIRGAIALATKLKNDVIGAVTDDASYETVRGARKLAEKIKTILEGDSDTDDENSATIVGAKKYTDAAIEDLLDGETIGDLSDRIEAMETGKADLENGKIPTDQLPDYILGQLLFGGTASGGTADTLVIAPSGNYNSKHGQKESQTLVTITKDTYKAHEGEYFIATAGFSALGIPVNTGDWIVSTGTDWKKIDNTDSITKVAGVSPTDGNIPAAGLATALGVDGKYEKPSTGIPKDDLAQGVKDSLGRADSAIQTVAIAGTGAAHLTQTKDTSKKQVTLSLNTTKLEDVEDTLLDGGAVGLATAADVYSYIKAAMSVKILSEQLVGSIHPHK
jgi:hypothetical protein